MTKPNAGKLTQEPDVWRSAEVGVGTTPEDAPSDIYDVGALVCPECNTYLLDKAVGAQHYKSCNSCGYAREVVNQLQPPLLGDDYGETKK